MIKLHVSAGYLHMKWIYTKTPRNSPIGKEIGVYDLQFNGSLTVINIRTLN